MLKYYRDKKGITQSQLAKAVGVPTATIAKYESEERDFNKIGLVLGLKIAYALGVVITDMIDSELFTVGVILPNRSKFESLRYFLEKSGYGEGYRINNAFADQIGYGFLIGERNHSSNGFEWMFSGECNTFSASDKLINYTIASNYMAIIKEIGIEKIREFNNK